MKPTFKDLFDILEEWCKGYKTVGDGIIAHVRKSTEKRMKNDINRMPRKA